MIIAPEGAALWAPPRARVDNTMVKAIARAFRWRRLLEEGRGTARSSNWPTPRRSTSPTSAGCCDCRFWLPTSSRPFWMAGSR
jgi:hypothetical protein